MVFGIARLGVFGEGGFERRVWVGTVFLYLALGGI